MPSDSSIKHFNSKFTIKNIPKKIRYAMAVRGSLLSRKSVNSILNNSNCHEATSNGVKMKNFVLK